MNNWLKDRIQEILQIFQDNKIQIGDTSLSIIAIFQLILYTIVGFFFVKSLKKFLKERLLIKLGINSGNREAISSIISYSIGLISFIVILQTTGFNLSSLVVIAGSLGVGIGFGLQDLTKNFVSGLTLLIERTVKVGDFIEFDGLEGFVKEISTRSTIITTKDGADVVVPNSQLVENRLINWTYDNGIGRIHIPVGVAYGTDPVIVTELLLKSAYMDPNILIEPFPKVIFRGFGDNSLNFELWVWVNRIDLKPEIISSLYFIIEYNLRLHRINIPFPQRDLWIRNPESFNFSAKKSEIEDFIDEAKNIKNIRDLLKKVAYFQNFNDLEIRQLIEIGYRRKLRQGEILFRENDPGDAFYIILSGSVKVFVEKIDKYLTTLESGQFLGELSLMLGIPRTATVKALEDTLLFSIGKKNFQTLLQEHPELYEEIISELSKHQEELIERQRQLKDLGLLDESEEEKNPVVWVRKRLQKIFNL
jgi:small-conductance mechanosensitive channel